MAFKLVEKNPKPTDKVLHVQQFIWEVVGIMTATKAHKLMYYAQALHLVKHGKPLFPDAIVAWPYGPVVRSLWANRSGVTINLPEDDKRAICEALTVYGHLTAAQLTRLSHSEAPWRDARKGLPANAKTSRIIPIEAIRKFYSTNGFVAKRSVVKQ